MTLTLLLIRHATAAPGEPDEARRLSSQGRGEAARMGRWVAAQGLIPGEALCSAARRARETLDLMLPAWTPEAPRVLHDGVLYAADPEAALAILARSEAGTVALVGHNPTIALLAERLARAPRRGGFPPATVAALRFEAERWDGIGWGSGEVAAWAAPGDVP